jgi:aminoglycoside phosphotransferase (APT) family kinase protein
VFLDATGALVGLPVLVITRMPGEPSPPPSNQAMWIDKLAVGLTRVHAFGVAALPPTFQRAESPVDHAARVVRRFAQDSKGLGAEVAAELVRTAPGIAVGLPTLVHGDFWFGNTLWSGGDGPQPRLTAILDWSAARIGDPGFDLASIRMDLAIVLGADAARMFLARYVDRRAAPGNQRFWDLIVGIAGLALIDEWVPTYHALRWTHLTFDDVRPRLDRFVRDALARPNSSA